MRRASFVVTVRRPDGKEIRYDADCLTLGRRCVGDGDVSTLSFRCSGEMETVDAEHVTSVIFHPTGTAHCPFCDQSLHDCVGHGIHKNPEPVAI